MPRVILYRITDFPVARQVLPLLHAHGVDEVALARWHYFYPKGFARAVLPAEVGLPAAVAAPLLAVCESIAVVYQRLTRDARREGPKGGSQGMTAGFHWSATEAELAEAFTAAGYTVVRAAEALAAERAPADPIDQMPSFVAINLKYAVPAKLRAPLYAYVTGEGPMPAVARLEAPPREFVRSTMLEHWSAQDERMLDVFVALTGRGAAPVWVNGVSVELGAVDRAGLLLDKLRARGVGEDVLLQGLCREGFGHRDWVSRRFALASFLGRLDAVRGLYPGALDELVIASVPAAEGLPRLCSLAVTAFVARAPADALSVTAWRRLHDMDAAMTALATAALGRHRAAVLASADPEVDVLMDVFADRRKIGEFSADEAKAFFARWAGALAAGRCSLEQLVAASHCEGLLGPGVFAQYVGAALERAIADEFRGTRGYDAQADFRATVAVLAGRDPDLCMRGFAALTATFNEHGLRLHVGEWDAALPVEGISDDLRQTLAARFSRPDRKSEAKILGALLERRGVQISMATPVPLEQLDAVLDVGTDVACLVLGSFDAVERLSAVEDLDAMARAVKKEKCVGFATGGDGTYTVRIVGSAVQGLGPALSFPLVIGEDTLTLSGLVGAGGTPTLAVPSGIYAAHVHCLAEGAVNYVVVLERVKKAPKWTFGSEDLPVLMPR